ncbi:transcription elongation factor GreA [Candidatus Nomurabacteria bacterium]|nr:transcription elongation factor GreA [Candidatus Nomurabacteria bacterium]
MNTDYLTKGKHDELEKELAELKLGRRKEVAERLEFAKSLGDLSENAEYHAAREEQAEIEDRINQLELLLKTSEIVNVHHSSVVEIGSTLTVEKLTDNSRMKLTLVGSEETDVHAGKISSSSPLGRALIGKKRGETIVVDTPRGEVAYKIISLD